MKRLISLVLLAIGILIALNKDTGSWVKRIFVSNPTPYYQQRTEFFQKLSKEYYGVADYGSELEAINRVLHLNESSSNRVELIIPSLDAIRRLKQRQTVVSLEDDPYTKIVNKNTKQLKIPSTNENTNTLIEKADFKKSSTIVIVLGILIFSAIISLISYLHYRRKIRRSSWLWLPDESESVISDDRILLDFDFSSFEENKDQAYS